MVFQMRPGAEREKIRTLIEHGGGQVGSKNLPNAIKLVTEGTVFLGKAFATKFIYDSVKKNRLMDINDYEMNEEVVSDTNDQDDFSVSTGTQWKAPRQRSCYTLSEDQKIIQYIIKTHSFRKVSSVIIWKDLESSKILGNRTWQSLKERFLKHILPQIGSYKLPLQQIELIRSRGNTLIGQAFEKISEEQENNSVLQKHLYTKEEEVKIVTYLKKMSRFDETKGTTVWKEMAKKKIINRTWQSMKERFIKHIVPNISQFNLGSSQLDLIKGMFGNRDSRNSDDKFIKQDQQSKSKKLNLSNGRLSKKPIWQRDFHGFLKEVNKVSSEEKSYAIEEIDSFSDSSICSTNLTRGGKDFERKKGCLTRKNKHACEENNEQIYKRPGEENLSKEKGLELDKRSSVNNSDLHKSGFSTDPETIVATNIEDVQIAALTPVKFKKLALPNMMLSEDVTENEPVRKSTPQKKLLGYNGISAVATGSVQQILETPGHERISCNDKIDKEVLKMKEVLSDATTKPAQELVTSVEAQSSLVERHLTENRDTASPSQSRRYLLSEVTNKCVQCSTEKRNSSHKVVQPNAISDKTHVGVCNLEAQHFCGNSSSDQLGEHRQKLKDVSVVLNRVDECCENRCSDSDIDIVCQKRRRICKLDSSSENDDSDHRNDKVSQVDTRNSVGNAALVSEPQIVSEAVERMSTDAVSEVKGCNIHDELCLWYCHTSSRFTENISSTSGNMQTINCHDGDIVLGTDSDSEITSHSLFTPALSIVTAGEHTSRTPENHRGSSNTKMKWKQHLESMCAVAKNRLNRGEKLTESELFAILYTMGDKLCFGPEELIRLLRYLDEVKSYNLLERILKSKNVKSH